MNNNIIRFYFVLVSKRVSVVRGVVCSYLRRISCKVVEVNTLDVNRESKNPFPKKQCSVSVSIRPIWIFFYQPFVKYLTSKFSD